MPTSTRTYVASFEDLILRTWATDTGYLWQVTAAITEEIVAQGEALSREDAMIDAAQAAGADWGRARWRSLGEDDGE